MVNKFRKEEARLQSFLAPELLSKDKKIVFVKSSVYVTNAECIKSANNTKQIGNSSCWCIGHMSACQQTETIEE